MPNNAGYQAILAKSKELGQPKQWEEDLTGHDYRVLHQDDAPSTFGWGIRETGTDLFLPGEAFGLEWAQACKKSRNGQDYFWFNGTVLRPIMIDNLIEKLRQSMPKKETTRGR